MQETKDIPRVRSLTPTECARLQTIPEWYEWQCSNTQQYKLLGNGWTVEVIKHILSFLPKQSTLPCDNEDMITPLSPEALPRICGSCALCIHTNRGCECSLTDNDVEYQQVACIDYLTEE